METLILPSLLGQPDRDTVQCTERLEAVNDALYVLGGKWKLRIIVAICDGHQRFNEIQRITRGITAKVLSYELKELELNGLVQRTVDPENAKLIRYEPTLYTHTLNDVLHSLAVWGVNHRTKLRNDG